MRAAGKGRNGVEAPNGETGGKRRWWLALRFGLAAALIAFLLWYFDSAEIAARLRSVAPVHAAGALAILGGQYLLASLRWHYILRRHGVPLRFSRSYAVYGIGALANMFAPTAVAGMSARGVLLSRHGAATSRILGILLAERLAVAGGFVACLLAGLAVSFPFLREGFGRVQTMPSAALAIAALLLAAAAVAMLALWRLTLVRRFAAEMRESFLSPGVILLLAGLSAVIIYLGFAAVAVLARGMGLRIEPVFFIAVMPVVALIAAAPISLGGWGVREGAMVAGLALFSVPAEAALALSICYGLAGVFVTVVLAAAMVPGYVLQWRAEANTAPAQKENGDAAD